MNKDQLIKTLAVQSESYNQFRMFAFIVRQLHEIDCQFFVEDGCIYITKGDADIYPCIVAHMDTVHKIVDDLTILTIGNKLTGFDCVNIVQTGIGGDDKVGIFIALECLKTFDNIKVVLFRDEEVGCAGSYNANMDFFYDCGFVLQCDRQRNSDFVTCAGSVPLSSNEFMADVKPIINKYGYKFSDGMMTDVMALKENGLKCSCANISCGYYHPHTKMEYVDMDDVSNCLDMVEELMLELGSNTYKHKYKRKRHYKYDPKAFSDKDFYGDWLDKPKKRSHNRYCQCCGEPSNSPLEYISDYKIEMCQVCIMTYIDQAVQ